MLNHEVTRWQPYLFGGYRDLDAVLDRFLGPRKPDIDWTPRMDVGTRDGHYVLRLDLPGVDPKDLDIEVEGRVLTIKGERKTEEQGHHYKETFHGRFERQVRLPDGIDTDRIKAGYKNGVAEIRIPLATGTAGRKVPIQTEGGEKPAIEQNAG